MMIWNIRRNMGWLAGLTLLLAVAASGAVQKYDMTGARNSLVFHAHSTGHDFEGKTAVVKGEFGCDRQKVAETAFGEARIPIRTLKTGISARDNEMYKIFGGDEKSEIVFKLRELKAPRWTGSDTFTATASGDLTVHGTTRRVPVEIMAGFAGSDLAVTGTARVKITDFGMEPPGFLFFKVSDDVKITFTVRGKNRVAS
ncbi:MAG: YceI family protein [Candidatus Hydrogenedentota bacterium]